MSTERQLLEVAERSYPPPPRAFDALVRTRRRRERNRRTATTVLALVLAAGAAWLAVHGFLGPSAAPRPGSKVPSGLGPEAASHLGLAWYGSIGGVSAPPVVADGMVFAGTSDRRLYAFSAGCGSNGRPCAPAWTGTVGGGIQYSSPAVGGGLVLVGAGDGVLYAFPQSCGSDGATCRPRWTFRAGASLADSSPLVRGDVAYVAADRVYAVALATGKLLWTGPGRALTSTFGMTAPAASGGSVFVATVEGALEALPESCGVTRCRPSWTASLGATPTSQPVVADGLVYVGAGRRLYAFADT